VKYLNNLSLNKGFLEINKTHKGKFTFYDYASNIKIYKDLTITMVLRSIQNQSLKDIEIILVNDGSLEEEINYVLNEIKNDNRIILLRHKEKKGHY
jgi:hypothetical protein